MQLIIYAPIKKAKRIKVFIPYKMINARDAIKKMNSSFWHPHQKLWSVINTSQNFESLKQICNGNYKIESNINPTPIPSVKLTKGAEKSLFELEKALVIKQYSSSTIQVYKKMFSVFLGKFMHHNIRSITKEDIEGFLYEIIKKNNISESYQNQLINAIKAYYEHALKMPREYYDIQRPKKALTIPNVLT